MSSFDIDTFLSATLDAPLQIRMQPIPAKDYLAVVSSHDKWLDVRPITEGKMAGRVVADIHFDILDDEVKAKLGMETVRVRKSYFLDFTSDGRLDPGVNKNVQLGQLFEACGMNKSGIPVRNLMGAGPIRIFVTQRPDDRDASIVYNDVGKVVSMTTAAKAA
jgi:hypothetical protein